MDELENKTKSEELFLQICRENLQSSQTSYEKIYDRLNIAMACYTVLLLPMLENFDFSFFFNFCELTGIERILSFFQFLLSLSSLTCTFIAIIKLLILSQSKDVKIFKANDLNFDSIKTNKKDFVDWIERIKNCYITIINDYEK